MMTPEGSNGVRGLWARVRRDVRTQGWLLPKRVRLNPEVGDAKSQAGRRVVGLPDELVQLLVAHRFAQDEQRAKARQLWQEGGWVFASAIGKSLSLNSDYREWKALLQAAGVPDGRLHDARTRRRQCSWSWVRRSGR
jgi:hypothetical protein